jgi:hypothetical protein
VLPNCVHNRSALWPSGLENNREVTSLQIGEKSLNATTTVWRLTLFEPGHHA